MGGRALVFAVSVSIVLMIASSTPGASGFFTGVRSVFQTVTMPVRLAGSLVTAPFSAMGNIVANLTSDQESLSELRQQNEQLAARNAELEEAAASAERLQGLLDLKNTYSLTSTSARIISLSSDSWSDTVEIDKGTSSGIDVGMPVTDNAGIIGQVISCGPVTSRVRLISDENSGVSAMNQQSRAQGVLKGSAAGTLYLTLIRTDQTVKVGDTVITSGLGGVFPKGLPIGKVSVVEKVPGALYYEIVVEPISSAGSLEEVLVITAISDQQCATADDIAEADRQQTQGSTNKNPSSQTDQNKDDQNQGDQEEAHE